jgi:dCTP deaminase
MSIKSDQWIRRMALDHGMIKPSLVGKIEGQKRVSFGTSSYGYDICCAPEFNIFTNINSTVIAPRAFDPKSCIEIDADACIILPNSFALTHAGEDDAQVSFLESNEACEISCKDCGGKYQRQVRGI